MSGKQREILSESYDRFGPDVYRYLSLLMGSRTRAEDVMQEVFLRLLRCARRDPEAARNRSYIFAAARNEAYRALAKGRRQASGGADGLLEIRDGLKGSDSERIAVEEALTTLPPEQREVVHLKTYMSMTFEEIAQLTAVSRNTAASRYRYALKRLRDLLGDEEDD